MIISITQQTECKRDLQRIGVEKMGATYTEAQKKAILEYQKDKVKVQILISPEQREKYRAVAKSKGMNLTQLIVQLLEEVSEKEI